MRRIVVLVVVVLGLCAAPAHAKDAPGAPGARHTWADADKHGFGTATALESARLVHAALGRAERDLLPGPEHAGFRDLEFAVTDGRRFLDRETDPGVRSKVEPVPGSLAFRQTTWTARWKLEKTWITDPARVDRARRRALRVQAAPQPLRVYVLADPAPGDDGNDDRGRSTYGALLGLRRRGRERRPRRPAAAADHERLRRLGERPARAARGPASGSRSYDATGGRQRRPGRPHAPHRPPPRPADLTLAIGFGRRRRRRRRDRAALARDRLPARGARTTSPAGRATCARSSARRPSVAGDRHLRRSTTSP